MSEAPVTLITGGSSGIGAALAKRLLNEGHRVAVTARGAERLERFAETQDEPERLLAVQGDASDFGDVTAAVEATVARFGRLDNAVANAGFATMDNLEHGDPEGWRDMVLTNVLGPALLIKAAIPALKESEGRLVLVGSVAGYVYTPGNIYGATKWAVHGMAENTRRMLVDDGVGVTLIAPGRVDTDFWGEGGAPEGDNLTDDQVAASIAWALAQPKGVDVNNVTIRPTGMAV